MDRLKRTLREWLRIIREFIEVNREFAITLIVQLLDKLIELSAYFRKRNNHNNNGKR